ncbi:hypothetical protein [Streptomyces sp. NPDC001781]
MPSEDELERMRGELSNALLAMKEQMAPVFDAADGMRCDMTARGWSPAAAERAALAWLLGTMNSIMGGGE